MRDILDRIAVVAAVNDETVLARDLMASPLLAGTSVERRFYRGARTIGAAYAAGLAETRADYVVFAHQDVYLPAGWSNRLAAAIDTLEMQGNSHWGVLGLIGVTEAGGMAGRVWSSGSAREFHHPIAAPEPARTLDELVLVVRRGAGIGFDPDLPHFHLYGTDIALTARASGLGVYVIDAPVIHNSDQLTGLGAGFRAAHRHLEAKWAETLPVRTPICQIEPGGRDMRRAARTVAWRYWRQRLLHGGANRALADPAAKARTLGYVTTADATVTSASASSA